MKPLDLLPNLTGIEFCVYIPNLEVFPYFSIRTLIELDRVGNTLCNKDYSITIDMERLKSTAKTSEGVFKSFTKQIIEIIQTEYSDSEDNKRMIDAWPKGENHLLVCYNKEMEQLYSYMWFADGRRRFLYLEKDLIDYSNGVPIFFKSNVKFNLGIVKL